VRSGPPLTIWVYDGHVRHCARLRGSILTGAMCSVYFGHRDKVDAVSTVLAVQALDEAFPWFHPSQ